jgi:hypothetical protein
MLATTEPTTIQRSLTLQPIEISDSDGEITLTVSISPDGSGGYHHDVYAISVAGPAGSQFTVTWILSPSQDLTAKFRDPGLLFRPQNGPLPAGVDHMSPNRVSDTEYRLVFVNNVADVNVIRYDLDFEVTDSFDNLFTRTNVVFDPSIAVVQDPIVG